MTPGNDTPTEKNKNSEKNDDNTGEIADDNEMSDVEIARNRHEGR